MCILSEGVCVMQWRCISIKHLIPLWRVYFLQTFQAMRHKRMCTQTAQAINLVLSFFISARIEQCENASTCGAFSSDVRYMSCEAHD